MRLKSIKLAGFKSFVDPTTVSFPSNLSAVVGPNGCGKSNIIDAVRWVMGESSAKNLRGESMTDVIFNGSGGRKPVGQASIELIFDNSDGSIVGEYANYAEISVKRKVTRDGQNSYYLNGSKCRRKDITDLFLGTGLGPRSYAIIEQGMISKLIEAKPEELRTTIEEAAGISKYKERRRDTENRINRTTENLERLRDIREELDRQLSRLERQARAAEQYAELKKEERWLRAQQLALRIRELDEKSERTRSQITELELKIEALVTERVGGNTRMEKLRAQHTELNDKFNEVQGRYYAAGSDIARLEQSIQHAEERSQQLRVDLDNSNRELAEAEENLLIDRQKAEEWQAELLELEPLLEEIKDSEGASAELLLEAENAMQSWQSEWDSFNQHAAKPQQEAEVQQSRIKHIEHVQVRLLERIERLRQEQAQLSESFKDDSLDELQEEIAQGELIIAEQRAELEQYNEQLENVRSRSRELQQLLDQERSNLQRMRGRHASLEALQQAAMAESSKDVSRWLEQQGIAGNRRLAEQLQVSDGWDLAVETVLGDSLQAVCVDGLDPLAAVLGNLEQGSVVLLDSKAAARGSSHDKATRLLDKVSSDVDLEDLLGSVYLAESLDQALALRPRLEAGESVITRDGIWLSASWLRVAKGRDASSGILERQQELESLEQQIAIAEARIAELEGESDELQEQIRSIEVKQGELRTAIDNENRKLSTLQSDLSARRVRIEESRNRQQRVASEIREAEEQMQMESENLAEARHLLSEAIEAMEANSIERERLMSRRDQLRVDLDNARQQARQDKDRSHEIAMRFQSVKQQLESTRLGIERLEQQSQRLMERREMLRSSIEDLIEPLETNRVELSELLEQRLVVEAELLEARKAMEEVEHELREAERARGSIEQSLQQLREELEQARLEAQTFLIQRQNNEQQLQQEDYSLEEVLAQLNPELNPADIDTELERIANRISRLGPINLAAIDEYKVEQERKSYLDAQNADLEEALETLWEAIRRIDNETRTRFKETFDQVNAGLQDLFPKVFGGGHAYLELTSDDLLETGISIMARPPGKRNSTIHLLSGGEKALTALALVFSIFRLNPAPFCMLDEVDAPLDDANVGRYAQLVAEMSENVQFIYITHNKISMEIAHQLLGVTMHEPGVSRVVAVDVDEAAELAAV